MLLLLVMMMPEKMMIMTLIFDQVKKIMIMIMTLLLEQVDITVEEEESTRQRLAAQSEVVDQRTGLDKHFIFPLNFTFFLLIEKHLLKKRLTRLTYNCAHLRSKVFWVKIFFG